jgi:carbamoyl-phosphate synthase small subunit
MTGYQEILTDPSYRGQIVVMTCPEIGNVGTNPLDRESSQACVRGFAIRELSRTSSNWRANQDLHQYLREWGIPGIAEIDTRALTRHIRLGGALKGILSSVDRNPESLVRKAREAPGLDEQDLVREATCGKAYEWSLPRDSGWAARRGALSESGDSACAGDSLERLRCVAYDFGAKHNIFRLLVEHGFDVTVVPATLPGSEVLDLKPDAVFLSNGPGDPATVTYAVESVAALLGKVPIFGICLGHQIAARALGARTFKLKFGHRGANHPVKDLRTGRVAVTSQNHGYAVDTDSLPSRVEVTHLNLNDHTCEGFVDADAKLLAVQYHPESSPGPHDSFNLFRDFLTMTVGRP